MVNPVATRKASAQNILTVLYSVRTMLGMACIVLFPTFSLATSNVIRFFVITRVFDSSLPFWFGKRSLLIVVNDFFLNSELKIQRKEFILSVFFSFLW